MSLTKIGSIGINTGIAFAGVTTIVTLNTANDALSIGATVNVGSGITLGASGDIFATGVCTATTFSGAVSGTTGTFSGAVSGTTGTFSGDVTTSGGDLTVTGTNPIIHLTDTDDNSDYQLNVNGGIFQVYDYTNTAGRLLIASDGTVSVPNDLSLADKIIHTGDTNTALRFPAADTISAETGGSERARIDSTGRVRIGCTAQPSTTVSGAQFDAGGKTLRISEGGGTSSTTGASVQITGGGGNTTVGAAAAIGAVLSLTNCNNTDNNQTSVDFSASSGLAIAKVIGKNDSHSSRNGSLIFATSSAAAPAERIRIGSAGQIGIGGANYGSSGQVLTSGGSSSAVSWTTVSGTTINNNANNKVITGSDTANTLEGEAYIFANSASLSIGTQSPAYLANLHIRNSYASMRIDSDGSNNDTTFLMKTGTNTQNKIHFGDAADDDVGIIKYDHNGDHMVFVTGTTERMRLNQYGLCLGGTGSANGLDDYEEGTFTPTIVFSSGTSVSYSGSSRNAEYVKVGNLVYIRLFVYASSTGTNSGTLKVGGLPFTPNSGGYGRHACSVTGGTFNLGSGVSGLFGLIEESAAQIDIYAGSVNGANVNINSTMWNGSGMYVAGTYHILGY